MADLDWYLSDPGQSGLFTRLARLGLLVDAFQHQALDGFGLRFIDFSVLRLLQLAGSPHQLSPSELAELTLRSTGGITQIVDRLESAGLVGRTPDAGDRRRVVVALTPKGLRLVEKAQERYAGERARVLAPLADGELDVIDGAVRRLLDLLTEDAAADAAAS